MSDAKQPAPRWARILHRHNQVPGAEPLFGREFLTANAARLWAPLEADRAAAAAMHVQLVSRIATRTLEYRHGVEATALRSLYLLFEITRQLCKDNLNAVHFERIAWHVLNVHVRPFTAKWHRLGEAGALSAMDGTNEFRAELAVVRAIMQRFDALLIELRDGAPAPPWQEPAPGGLRAIEDEMAKDLHWGIPPDWIGAGNATAITDAERVAIKARRTANHLSAAAPHASGLALSGGGIRSATFCLGVLTALARRNLLPQFDYLSTVSGGGYFGAFLTTFVSNENASLAMPDARFQLAGHPDPVRIFNAREEETAPLRNIRHSSKYLSGSPWESLTAAAAQIAGMLANILVLALLPLLVALVEHCVRPRLEALPPLDWPWPSLPASWTAFGTLLAVLIVLRLASYLVPGWSKLVDGAIALLAFVLLVLAAWLALGLGHTLFHNEFQQYWWYLAFIPPAAVIAIRFAARFPALRLALAVAGAIAAPALLIGLELATYDKITTPADSHRLAFALLAAFLVAFFLLDVNFTALHRFYRRKLAKAYLTRFRQGSAACLEIAPPLNLSGSTAYKNGPYHLVNAALNVPASKDPAARGRLADFFLFSPEFCGSPLTGYCATKKWESANPTLDLATAMAISGAAAAPLSGMTTIRRRSFWLALLNIRLGYWLRKPGNPVLTALDAPGLMFLLREMFAQVHEKTRYLNLSDGGHIENLGVYELLRRRCKYIVAIDGEHDPAMTFHALTNLQRLAAIDLGITIEADLNDLRLAPNGFSRTHFHFCRIRYPDTGDGDQIGYLLYAKLSLTGNEGEFLRRYRLDEQAFPHHSTANQFFSEAQFEAYRSLGEHVGERLFDPAVVGEQIANSTDVTLEAWLCALGRNTLTPLPIGKRPMSTTTSRFDTVIFDLGGVLIDWDPRHLYRRLLAGDEAAVEHFLTNVCTPEWNRMQDAGRPFAEAEAEAAARHPDKLELFQGWGRNFHEMIPGAIEGTVAILNELRARRVPLYALTNWSAEMFAKQPARFEFLSWFDGIVVSGQEKLIKPDPQLFQVLLARHAIDPTRAVFIDDVPANAAAAAALGIRPIHFTDPAALRRELVALNLL